MPLAETVRKLRTERGLSIRALGRAANIAHQNIANIESGRQPRRATVDALEGYFKRRLWHLVGDTQ